MVLPRQGRTFLLHSFIKKYFFMKIQWRPYQVACKQAIKQNYDRGVTKQLVVSATGTGKRIMSLDLTRHFPRTLFLAHREELIQQAQEEIEQLFPFQSGIIKGSRFEIHKKVTIASVQTLYNRLDKINPESFDLIIIDEAHHYCAKSYLKTVRHFQPKLMIGWTATPKRLDGLSLSNIAEKIVFEYRIQDGIKEGFLAPVTAYQIKTGTSIANVKKSAGDFNVGELSQAVDTLARNQRIVDKYREYADGRQAIAYCVDIDHAYHLRDVFRKEGYSCETIVSDQERCDNRSDLVDDFKNGKIQILTNVNILTEGFDYSDVGAVLMARPTQSETLYVQCVGRGTRIKSQQFRDRFNTNATIVLDFVDNTGRHSLVNSYELEKDKPIEERMFLPPEQKEKLLAERQKRIIKIRQEAGGDAKIDLLRLPEVKPWNSKTMLEPATEKQIKWMQDIGVWQPDTEYTRIQASELLSAQKATAWQITFLARNGYDVSGGASLGQYQKVKWLKDQREKFAIK
jgi:superfamily II DNA or RNA helicase